METPLNLSAAPGAEAISARRDKTFEEGMIGGVLGAATIAVWFFVLDLFRGAPLFTPSLLGTALFGSSGSVAAAMESAEISFRMVLMFTWVHGLAFVVLATAAAWLIRLAERDPNYGFGILLFFVIFEFGFIGFSLVFSEGILHALAIPEVLIGNLLAAAVMSVFFYRRHPNFTFHP